MIEIKEFLKYEKGNNIEVTWVEIKEEKFIKKEIVDDKEVETVNTKTVEKTIHCQSFSDTQIDLLRQTAKDFNTPISIEQELIIKDVIANIILPTQEELEAISIEKEKQRVLSIKQEAGRIIESKYNIYWQLNHPRLDATYANEYKWIDNIRGISNKAELEGTAFENIDWGI